MGGGGGVAATGVFVGEDVGVADGEAVTTNAMGSVGPLVGKSVGLSVSRIVGRTVGATVGMRVGLLEGGSRGGASV